MASEQDHVFAFDVIAAGTFNLFEAARNAGVNRIVLASSRGVFGLGTDGRLGDWTLQRPVTLYGNARLFGEGMVRWCSNKHAMDIRTVRYGAIVGPGIRTAGHPLPDRPTQFP